MCLDVQMCDVGKCVKADACRSGRFQVPRLTPGLKLPLFIVGLHNTPVGCTATSTLQYTNTSTLLSPKSWYFLSFSFEISLTENHTYENISIRRLLDVHFYGRQLLNLKQTDEATRVYQLNYKKYPNQFTTNVGLGRAYSSKGDFKKAISYMKAALQQAPDGGNKTHVENMIKKLEEGQDINNN